MTSSKRGRLIHYIFRTCNLLHVSLSDRPQPYYLTPAVSASIWQCIIVDRFTLLVTLIILVNAYLLVISLIILNKRSAAPISYESQLVFPIA